MLSGHLDDVREVEVKISTESEAVGSKNDYGKIDFGCVKMAGRFHLLRAPPPA
jgi:hypothetical protein